MSISSVIHFEKPIVDDEQVFEDTAYWQGRVVQRLKVQDLMASDLMTFSTNLVLGMMFTVGVLAYWSEPILTPIPLAIAFGFYKLHEYLAIDLQGARQRLFSELEEGEIELQDVVEQFGGIRSFTLRLSIGRFNDVIPQLQKVLLQTARDNPKVFFERYEMSYGWVAKTLDRKEGLWEIANHWTIPNDKEIVQAIEKNLEKIPIYILMQNQNQLAEMGIDLKRHPKIKAFIEKHETKFYKLRMNYFELKEDQDSREKVKRYTVPIFAKPSFEIRGAILVSPYVINIHNMHRWFIKEIVALENLWEKEKSQCQ